MEWIKCNDELPPFGQGVLIYIDSGHITVGYRSHETSPLFSKDYVWQLFGDSEKSFGLTGFNEVTHWMYLPEPPKE